MVPDRQTMLTLGLVAALAVSGCLSTGPLSDQEEQRVAEKFEDHFEDIDGYTATVHMEMDGEFDNTTMDVETTSRVWQRPGTGEMRQEVRAPAEQAGDVTVTNDSASIHYDASENNYTKTDLSGIGDGMNDLTSQLHRLLENYDVVYEGTETLDGRETHRVTLEPTETSEALGDYEMGMWVDSDTWFPVKQQMGGDELGVETTVRYENVTLDPGIPDEKFEFDPPADATERETGFDTYDSRSELADATNVTLPEPDLPEGYAFDNGVVSEYNSTTSVTLQYDGGEESLTVSVDSTPDDPREDGESVDLGNRTGRYSETNGVASLWWTCEETSYSVFGQLGKETVVDVGSSIECPA